MSVCVCELNMAVSKHALHAAMWCPCYMSVYMSRVCLFVCVCVCVCLDLDFGCLSKYTHKHNHTDTQTVEVLYFDH